jgi:hypothetical protein
VLPSPKRTASMRSRSSATKPWRCRRKWPSEEKRDRGHGDRRSGSQAATPKLADLGITKTQSSKWQRLAELPQPEFEAKVARATKKALSAIDGTTPLPVIQLS